MTIIRLVVFLGVSQAAWAAAPLDALLNAYTHHRAGEHLVEVGVDAVNSTLDVLQLRDNTSFAGTNVGDYFGQHIRGGIGLTDRLWLEGSYWNRELDYRSDTLKLNSWQAAAQYRLNDPIGSQLAWSIRAGAWSNYSDALSKSTPTTISGIQLDTVSVQAPQDRQAQFDIMASSLWNDRSRLNLFAGLGKSRVDIQEIRGMIDIGYDCRYNLTVDQKYLSGKLIKPCTFGSGFFVPPPAFKFRLKELNLGNPFEEINYVSRYWHAGASLEYFDYLSRVRFGVEYQWLERETIDRKVAQRGGTVVDDNTTFIADYSRRLGENWGFFVRGQLMWHQLTGDVPLAYNTFTASQFNQMYGFFSVGLLFRLW